MNNLRQVNMNNRGGESLEKILIHTSEKQKSV